MTESITSVPSLEIAPLEVTSIATARKRRTKAKTKRKPARRPRRRSARATAPAIPGDVIAKEVAAQLFATADGIERRFGDLETRVAVADARASAVEAECAALASMPEQAPTVVPALTVEDAVKLGVVDQVRLAFQRGNRLALVIGFLFGFAVPFATFRLVHFQIDTAKWSGFWTFFDFGGHRALIALGGLVYSAISVTQWARKALRAPVKAVAFTILMEGVLVASIEMELSIGALVYLMLINGIATGVTLALDKRRVTP